MTSVFNLKTVKINEDEIAKLIVNKLKTKDHMNFVQFNFVYVMLLLYFYLSI